jgi:ABC-type sulfate/molybdate transport systems ATPase subunit
LSAFDEVWTKAADLALAALPVAARDQVEALVREICRNPMGLGWPKELDGPARDRVAVASLVAVTYQVDELERQVHIAMVRWAG